jgi:serine/threonine protein kinase
MPAPVTPSEFLELVQKSGVVDAARLASYLQPLRDRNEVPATPTAVAQLLVRDAIITLFQAEQLLLGKWKRFTIGKYKVLERIGTGGMGQVFLCEHKLMRRRVAVKVLPTAKAEDEAALERFYREARAVAALDHPNLVRAFDIDQDQSLHFLVMEYIDGVNLHELVKKTGPLSPTRACHYIYQAAFGLQHAYDCAGLIHRDIKPGNILVDRAGVVKILDMGLARFFRDEHDLLTKKYDETLGTADYLAPEQAVDSHRVDVRADIYSLGATFYFLLTGVPPFAEGTVAQKLMWHQTRMPTPVRERRAEVPVEISAIVERMMMKDVATRFAAPADVLAALEPFVQTPIPAPSEKELPQLSPAARMPSGFATPSPGRVAVPKLAPAPMGAPVVKSVPVPDSHPVSVSSSAEHAAAVMPTGSRLLAAYNPYVHAPLPAGSGPPSPVAHQAYVTASQRAAQSLQSKSRSDSTPPRTHWVAVGLAMAIVLFFCGYWVRQAGLAHPPQAPPEMANPIPTVSQ